MAKKSKKDNKNAIIGCVCAGVVAVVVIVIAIVMATSGSGALGDSYFVSDGTKYVATLETSESDSEDDDVEYRPLKTHFVYTYSGDKVTGLKAYYEYADAATAKKALEVLQSEENGDEFADATVDGKYVIVPAPAEEYEGMTASDAKEQVEFIEALQNMDLDDPDVDEVEDVEDEEDEE